jgi:hypothetical protein
MGEIVGWLVAACCITLFVAFAVASAAIAVLSVRTPSEGSCSPEGYPRV